MIAEWWFFLAIIIDTTFYISLIMHKLYNLVSVVTNGNRSQTLWYSSMAMEFYYTKTRFDLTSDTHL